MFDTLLNSCLCWFVLTHTFLWHKHS